MSVVGGDWRNSPAYDYFDDLDPEKIAHEFLRRNDQYAADYATLPDGQASDDPPPALTRWGLRFRGRPAPPRRSGDHRMAPGAESQTGPADATPGKSV